jgi:DNA-binding CsgD family transcriptional regulator
MLHPHIARAVQVQLRLASANLLKARALDALDRCSDGVLFVTLEGVVLWANGRAESILTANEGLRIIRKVLTCSRASESDALRRSIASCATNHDGGGGVIAVHRTVGRPLSVLVAALRGEPPFALEPIPAAIVFVTDPDRLVVAPRSHLRDLYGLTEAEARAADAVLDARGLSDIADKLGVSLSTVRTLLQRAFEKTDTHRQSELVQLLLAHRVPFIEK